MSTAELGSVSWGTMRSEDLISSFLDALDDLDHVRYEVEVARALVDGVIVDDGYGGWVVAEPDDSYADADYVDHLFDVLGEYAPDGAYFGAHPGDGSDYGFWMCEDYEYEEEVQGD